MRFLRLALLVGLFALVFYVRMESRAPTNAALTTSRTSSGGSPALVQGVPQKALDVLKEVRSTGEPPEGYVGGRTFQNREGRLPADGDYREFDVDPHDGQRNAQRLIVEWKTKKAWYTGDHYQTFTELP